MTATSLNFALLDANRPEVARLIAAMVQARDAVEHHSWSHPQQLTGEEWWADVLADPRARKREGHTDPQSSERIRLSKKCTLVREGCKSEAGGGGARRPFIMSDPSRRSCVQAKLKDLIERASSVADANLHRRKKPYPFGFAVRSNGPNFAFILDDTADNGQAIAQIKTLFLQHNVMSYVLAVAAISQGKQFVLFTAEDKSGLMVGHREIIVQPASFRTTRNN